MIRIDLAKDELEAQGEIKPSFISGIKLPPFLIKLVPNVNLANLVIVAISIAFAVLPHLFFLQYKTYIETEHQVKIRALLGKIKSLSEEIGKLASLQGELQSYEQQKKVVSEKLSAVRELLAARGTSVNVLDTLGTSLPRRTWLTDIELKLAGEGVLMMKGHAYSNEEISDYLDKLAESVYLGEVRLETVTSEAKDKVTTRSFTISARPKTQFKGPEGGI